MALDLGLLDTATAPTVRRPVLTVTVDGDAEALAGAVMAVAVDLDVAPGVDRCTVTVATSAAAVPLGATVAVSADAGDGATLGLVTGTVAAVRTGARGATNVEVMDASGILAGLRVERSYEQQTAGDITRDLCATAGVQAGDVADGARYPFVVLDAGRPAWRHLGRLAAHGGLLAGVDADGAVRLAPPAPGDVAGAFAAAVDVLALEVVARVSGALPGIVGEGAAGSHGSDAWAWLARDPTPVRADLDAPPRADAALRTPEAVTAAAEAATAWVADRMDVMVPLAPALRPGLGVQVDETTATALRVRHRWRAGARPVTDVEAAIQAGAGLPGGGRL